MIKMIVILSYFMSLDLQLNLSTTATLAIEESGHCKEVAIVERLKQEGMYGLSARQGRARYSVLIISKFSRITLTLVVKNIF